MTAAKNFSATAYGLPVRDHTALVSYFGMIGGGLAFLAFTLCVLARIPFFGGIWGCDDCAMVVTMVRCRTCNIYYLKLWINKC